MKYLKHLRGILISAAIVCVCIRIVWWAIEPMLPYLLGGIVLITLLGTIIGIAINRTKF